VSPATIRRRTTATGARRFDVRYRLGGRGYPVLHGGTFPTLKEARQRRDMIAGEIASGRDPRLVLDALGRRADPRTLAGAYEAFIASRVDVTEKTREGYRHALQRLCDDLAGRVPATLTVADWQAWVASCSDLAPGTLASYLSVHRQVLDFADVQPNTARSPKVKLPSSAGEEPIPPSAAEWATITLHVRERSLLVLRLLEATALRVGEAVELQYGDVDFTEGRLRISRARSKGRTAGRRWLPVPPELLDEIADLCPVEDRTRDRRVFSLNEAAVWQDLARACRDAGILHYHPHDLRHRRVSLWIAHGIDVVTVKTWAGHTRASLSTDVYGHVVVPGEDEWRGFWLAVYDRERRVRTREKERTND
jgi:integrase